MKRFRRYGLAVGALALGTGILIACGDEDSVILATPDGGPDARVVDSATDSSSNDVTSVDVNAPDVFTPPPVDAGRDVETADADAPDADASTPPHDAQADVEVPPVDAGAPDADASDVASEFPGRVAAQICETTARCCFGNEGLSNGGGVDGGTYNQTKCYNTYFPNGFDQSNPGGGVDFSKVTYNPTKGAECLGRIKVLACGANAAEYRAIVDACYAAMQGKGGAGAACTLSSECQTGFFCNVGKPTPVCEAIRATPSACGDWTTNAGLAQNSCSNRYSSVPPRFCRFSAVGNGASLPPASWTCNDALPAGGACQNNTWCDPSTVCSFDPGDIGPTCKGFITLFQSASCKAFVTP